MVTAGLVLMVSNSPNDSDVWFVGIVALAILYGIRVFIEEFIKVSPPDEAETTESPQQDSGGDS